MREGENEIAVIVDGHVRIIVHLITIGPADGIVASVHWSGVFNGFLVAASAFAMLFVAMLFLAVTWPAEDRFWTRAAIALLISWCICNLVGLGLPSNFGTQTALTLDFVAQFLMMFAFAAFVLARARYPRQLVLACWGVGVSSALAVGIAGSMGLHYLARYGYPAEYWIKLIMAPLLIGALIWSSLRRGQRMGSLETVAIAAVVTALAIDAYKDLNDQALPFVDSLYTHAYHQPWFGLVFALGLCAMIATQASQARRIAVNHNAMLQDRLAEQEAQLAAAFARENDIMRQETLIEERQRLMRDMHDGIGGQLVALIVRARAADIEHGEMSRRLVDVLEELRLIVDSLDTAGESLAFAAGGFRHRLEPQLKAVGLALNWDVDVAAEDLNLGPEKSLQVLRILQEACSNIVQHSKATTLSISLKRSEADRAFVLKIADDGQGTDLTRTGGKGMASMASRAAAIGARYKVTSSPGAGMTIELTFPVSPPRADGHPKDGAAPGPRSVQ